MTHIDYAVLDCTEWLCRKFQMLTGKTNIWVAVQLTNLSVVLYFLVAGLYFLSSDLATRVVLVVFCGALLYLLTQTIFKDSIELYENAAYRRVAQGLRNPRRLRDALLRLLFLMLSILLFMPIALVYFYVRVSILPLTYFLIVLTTVVLYLLACDPLPPCAGQLRAWLRRPMTAAEASKQPVTAA